MTLDRDTVATAVMRAVKLDDKVPREKASVMVQRTILGVLFVAVGIAGLAVWGMNHYLAAAFILVGATTWSTQVVTGALKALVGPLANLRRSVKGD